MSAERQGRAVYLDSSAIVKLVLAEPESMALRRSLRRRRALVSSALSRTEVIRAALSSGPAVVAKARAVLRTLELARVNDRVLDLAGEMLPLGLRSLDAIHLATAQLLGTRVVSIVSYDARLLTAASEQGFKVTSPV